MVGHPLGFETYLQQYADLWRALKGFQVIYSPISKRTLPAARRRFATFLSQLENLECDPDGGLRTR